MAKIDLKFIDFIDGQDYIKAEKFKHINSNDFISIFGENLGREFEIILDKSTAIKFAKTLRTEINKIKEVQNG